MRLARSATVCSALISDAKALRKTSSSRRYLSTPSATPNVVKSPFRDVTWPRCTLPELIWESLDKWPDKVALECGITGKSITYAEMKKSSRQLGVALLKSGLRPGDTVTVIMPNIPEYPIIILGAMEAGIVVSAINPIYSPAVCNCATYVGQWMNYALSGQENEHLNENNVISFQIVVFAIVGVGTITSILFLILVPEGNPTARSLSTESATESRESTSSFAPVKTILAHWKLHYIGFIYLNTRLFVVAVQALLTLYLHEALNAHAYETASVPLVLNVFCFLTSLATPVLLQVFGRKSTFSVGTLLGTGAVVWTFFGEGDMYSHGLIYIVAALYGCACAILQVTSLALIAEYIGEDVHHGAFIYGYMSFLDKISTGITLALILHFRVEGNKNYFTYAVTGCCLISSVAANIALFFLRFPVMSPEGSVQYVSKAPPSVDGSKDKVASSDKAPGAPPPSATVST